MNHLEIAFEDEKEYQMLCHKVRVLLAHHYSEEEMLVELRIHPAKLRIIEYELSAEETGLV